MTVEEIKEYIIQNYRGGGIKWEDVTSEKETIDKCLDFFFFFRLDFNGKHDSVIVKNCLRKYLCAVGKKSPSERSAMFQAMFGISSICENEILLCLAYALDSLGVTEHSRYIHTAWLTREGEMLLWLLNHDKDIGIYLRGLYKSSDSSTNAQSAIQ